MNKEIDKQLSKIEHLNRLPWIGKNYFSSDVKLMVLGESHYLCDGDDAKNYGKEFTRAFITQHRNEEETTKVIRNFEKTLLNKDTDEEVRLAEKHAISDSIVYQVLVQRLMPASRERPDNNDFENGWKVIFETMKILKPKKVISLGVKAGNVLTHLEYDGLVIKKEKWAEKKINGAYPRYCKIELNGSLIDIIFLRHTSGTMGGYYPKEWHKFLKKYFDITEYKKELKI